MNKNQDQLVSGGADSVINIWKVCWSHLLQLSNVIHALSRGSVA